MDIALLLVRLLLAGVFAVSGVAKLADRAGSRQAMTDFGVPKSLAGPFGVLLPLAELAVAAALLPAATAWWGALGALALLLLFVAGIGANLARGRKPDCRCFGQLHSTPAGWSTLVRNAVLAALAAFVVWRGYGAAGAGPDALSWLGGLSTAGLLGLLFGLVVLGLLGIQGWFLLHLLRQNGRLMVRLQALEARLGGAAAPAPSGNGSQRVAGLPVGSAAPDFGLRNLRGEEVTLEKLRAAGEPVLLFFTSPDCGPCTELLPEIGRWQEEHSEKLTISVISHLSAEENRTKVTEHGLEGSVLLQEDWEVAEPYGAEATPSAVLVRPDGTIGSPLAEGPDAVEDLVAHAVGGHAHLPMLHSNGAHATHGEAVPAPSKVGAPAPEVGLRDLEGRVVSLEEFRGKETLLLFWSPSCGHCQNMLPDLKKWEANPPKGAPELIVVSDGTVKDNREQGLRSPVVLDEGYRVSDAFGAQGTPSAVLVDAEGRVASTVVGGAQAVLQLAGAGRPRIRRK